MHVQLLVKVNYNMMITTTSIVGTYHHHINLKWNSLGHNQMRKRGHTIKKKGHIFDRELVIYKFHLSQRVLLVPKAPSTIKSYLVNSTCERSVEQLPLGHMIAIAG